MSCVMQAPYRAGNYAKKPAKKSHNVKNGA